MSETDEDDNNAPTKLRGTALVGTQLIANARYKEYLRLNPRGGEEAVSLFDGRVKYWPHDSRK
jgi:hypothetical protein